jgi:GH43 family beta-xylosidase
MLLSEMTQANYYVLCYTRIPLSEEIYAPKLAYSMHLSFSEDGEHFRELNHNSGLLFAKATDNPDGTMNAKSLRNPYLFQLADGTYGVIAVRTMADGSDDEQSTGSALLFTSSDLIHYTELGLVNLNKGTYVHDIKCVYDTEKKHYYIHWCDANGNFYCNTMADITRLTDISAPKPAKSFSIDFTATDIEGIMPRNILSIPKEIAHRLVCKLTVPYHVKTEVAAKVTATSETDLNRIRATAIYSDGTMSTKRIDWDSSGIDWNKSGSYSVTGTIHQDHYEFPIAINRADPCIGKWNGKYYFIATNDADNNHSLFIRQADSIPELIHAEEVKILDTTMYEHLGNLLWAPEFHIIGDQLYIFHAGTPGEFLNEQSHVMKLKSGGDPMNAADWDMPLRVVKKDGSYLFENGITLDMTCFEHQEKLYVIWAQRQFVPVDLGSWLYIAEADKAEPWKLLTDPVLLSKPDYGWANNHTFVDEGPFCLITDEKIFVTFSSALVDATYTVGLLSIDKDSDLLDGACWTKENYPLLTSRSVPGEYGPGHNAYVIDDDGIVWNTYHARNGIDQPRSSGIRRVHFDIDGYPVLDLIEENDVNRELAKVSITVVVL